MTKAFRAAVVVMLAGLCVACGGDVAAVEGRLARDARAVLLHREGLRAVIRYVESQPAVFPPEAMKETRLLRREEKEAVWQAWQRLLDYLLALDSIEAAHAGFLKLDGPLREEAFLTGYAAMVAKYRAAMDFIMHADRNAELDKVLNDPVPELGLPGGMYAKLKIKYLNVAMATDFAARELLMKTFRGKRQQALRAAIQEDAGVVWQAGRGQGELLTLMNAGKVIQDAAQSAWLPVQTEVSEWMGDTKVHRQGRSLITPAQVRRIQPQLQPGDVLLERREWYLSNVGLPGFWSHAALYLGTAEERRSYFNDPAVVAWVKSQSAAAADLDALLLEKSPQAHANSGKAQEEGHAVRVIEAMSEGVVFTSLEHTAACDSIAVLRPRLPKAEKARALLRAFHYAGRPYDFNFDFSTDAELVCTELIYKSYEPANGMTGLQLPLVDMLGRKVTPANELAKQFDQQYQTPRQQFEMVLFLDGLEGQGMAVDAPVADFRKSWQRPKWHVLVQ